MTVESARLVTVFGGSGFVGRHVVRALARRGYRVRVAVRRPDLAGFLQPIGSVGQIHAVQANLRYPASVVRAIDGADVVVNLVGILAQTGQQRFDSIQTEGARAVAAAAATAGIGTLVHVSAIGADVNSASVYARTKARGEQAILTAVPSASILRPSIIFGPEDNFFNQFAMLAGVLPVLPLIGGGGTRFQPVFVGDVAEAVARAVEGRSQSGAVYELGGPEVKTFKELLQLTMKEAGRERPLLPLPFGIAKLQASVMQLLPKPLLTVDQVVLLHYDNVVSDAAVAAGRTLKGLGIEPVTLGAILPSYLWRFRKGGQFAHAPR